MSKGFAGRQNTDAATDATTASMSLLGNLSMDPDAQMELHVTVVAACLTSRPRAIIGPLNGYARVAVDEEAQRTRVAWGTDAPQWEEDLVYFPKVPSGADDAQLVLDLGLWHRPPDGPDVKVASAAVMLSRMPDGEFSEHAVDLDDAAQLIVRLKAVPVAPGRPSDISSAWSSPRDTARTKVDTAPDPKTTTRSTALTAACEAAERTDRQRVEESELDAWISLLEPFANLERRYGQAAAGDLPPPPLRPSVTSRQSDDRDQETEDGVTRLQRLLWRQQQAEMRLLDDEALDRQMADARVSPGRASETTTARARHEDVARLLAAETLSLPEGDGLRLVDYSTTDHATDASPRTPAADERVRWHTDCSGCCGWPRFHLAAATAAASPVPKVRRRPSMDKVEHIAYGLRWQGCGGCPCCALAGFCAQAYHDGRVVV